MLSCLQDLSTYNKSAVAIAKKYFNIAEIDDFYKKNDPKPLIFCHFAKGLTERVYNEVTDFTSMYNILIEVRKMSTALIECLTHSSSMAMPSEPARTCQLTAD